MTTDLQRALERVTPLALAFAARDQSDPVRPVLVPEEAESSLELAIPETGRDIDEVLDRVAAVLHATPATAGPRFFNQLFGGRDAASAAGDMLASLANNSMYTYKVAGPMVLMENLLVRHMGAFAGFSNPEGVFTPGGSLSNLAGLLCARQRVAPSGRDAGVDGRTLRVYSSAESHYSVRKGASIIGVGRHNVVAVDCDPEGRMLPAALATAIERDLEAGLVPMAVNATAGTTVQGAFDPLDAIADVCAQRGVWLHVDGAYGGSMLLSPARRHLLHGLARADSFTWDAHKMMGVPLTCSVILVREPGQLTDALNETAGYLYQGDTDLLNPGTRSLQCGRRNDVLKLWAAWQHHGDAGYAARVEQQVAVANTLADLVDAAPDMHLTRRPQALNVCFTVDGASPADLCTRLNEAGEAMVGYGTVNGRAVMRAACLDPTLQRSDLVTLLEAIRSLRG